MDPDVFYDFTNESLSAIIAGLDPQPEDTIVAIAGSGDQAFALLESGARVIAVDHNSKQIDFIKNRIQLLEQRDDNGFLFVEQADEYIDDLKDCLASRNDYFLSQCRLDIIHSNIDNLSLHLGDIGTLIPQLADSGVTKVYLSNLFSHLALKFKEGDIYDKCVLKVLEYIAALLAFFSIYRGMTIVLKKHMDFHPKGFMEGVTPIYIKKGKTGVLLIHGFTSSPYEYSDLAPYLAKKNITVYAPLIKGHGTSPENLATTNDKDWLDSMRKAFKKLKKECDHTYIVGTSMGGNIAIILASEFDINGLILIAPPLVFRKERFWKASYQVMRLLKNFQKKRLNHKTLKNVKIRKGYYDKIPLNVIKFVTKIIIEAKLKLKEVDVPTLVMQSTDDVWVHHESINFIKNNIKSKNVKAVLFEDAYHVLIMEKDNEKYSKEIYEFIQNIENNPILKIKNQR